ncbi:MAG: RnfABCDGE type electron transport complex subunit D [Tetragenococcus halophilus]|uniref:RnfABCDGE type electron transport complex subunit D n=2 Tax=Tetragenococcus halophilus TaxID=51669 RepID=A0A3G5FLL4_TETHA|nr:RnfABCDGE type electron transport complex subunit D [Tetragenococcus halophilus]AYW51223.1 RnfABCDGE type electron transport complex subunit D [Tetragenococcus halophilus]MCO8291336.1 RnfABCDGE type electron transport complex subunit D [Tetragenococcus halophilus]MCO8295824.1 RnfABCDGE type electron transport complex subunit D [Tetragenococcus halophilus]MDN5830486.1 RnfABCDGE type electron transport complex subunit D [Tetragenococcus halophilus]MDN6140896.1 RnfABCDGE type electron transpor
MENTIDRKKIENNLKVGPSPHIRSKRTVEGIMTEVLIALVPPIIAAVYFFGWWVFVQLAVAIIVAVFSEFLYQKITYQKVTIHDRSALVTGTLIGLSFPITAPLWVVAITSLFAIVVVKQWNLGLGKGGIGRNYLNPAVTARVCAKIFFTPFFTDWVLPTGFFGGPYGGVDAVSSSTPLEFVGHGAQRVSDKVPDLGELFLGLDLGGNIGETSKLAIVIGMLFLIFRRIINPKIPILFIGSTVLVMCFWGNFNLEFMLTHALTGTLFFGATYMATDYSSGALTPAGKTIFAVGGGVLTALIRMIFDFPGGFGIAIIIMNICAPFIDQKLMPRIYGHKKRPDVKFDRQNPNQL